MPLRWLVRLHPQADGDPETAALSAPDAASALSLLRGALGSVALDSLMLAAEFELPEREQGLVDSLRDGTPIRWIPGAHRGESSGLWVAFVLVQPGPLSPFDPQLRQGCLRVFTACADPEQSLVLATQALAEQHCKVLMVDWLVDARGTAWAREPDEAQRALLEEAAMSGRAVLGRFHLWEEKILDLS